MPIFSIGQKNITFVHIPKTGGSSIEAWLTSFEGATRMLLHRFRLPDMNTTPQHLNAETIRKLMGKDFDLGYKFTVVRNPYARLESEFKYRIDHGLLKGHKRPESLFSEWVIHNLRLEMKSPGRLDNHLRPQTYFLEDDVAVYKFEDTLIEVANRVAKVTELGPFDMSVFPRSKISTKREVKWTRQAADLAANLYQSDFEYFGYNKSDMSAEEGSTLRHTFNRYYYFARKERRNIA